MHVHPMHAVCGPIHHPHACMFTPCMQFVAPYTFPSFHQRILEPYNYYDFGQRYVASLTDFHNSVLGHPERWDRMAKVWMAG